MVPAVLSSPALPRPCFLSFDFFFLFFVLMFVVFWVVMFLGDWGKATDYGRQIFPSAKGGDGFYYSRLQKNS